MNNEVERIEKTSMRYEKVRILMSRLDVFGHCLDVLILISFEHWHVNTREQYNPKIYIPVESKS